MRKKRILQFIPIILIVIFAIIGIGHYFVFVRPLPTIDGHLIKKSVQQPVTIARDAWGIPLIKAQSNHDLFWAIGYTMAQDRLFQMELSSRAGLGQLAELFGQKAFKSDRFIHTIGLPGQAQAMYAKADEQMRGFLNDFSAGVNSYRDEIIENGKLPFEYRLLGIKPRLWKPEYSMAVGAYLTWSLAYNYKSEILYMQLAGKLGGKKARELLPYYPTDMPVLIPPQDETSLLKKNGLWKIGKDFEPYFAFKGGSNCWVVGPERSASGGAMLANDTHMSGGMVPGTFYTTHLMMDSLNVYGAMLPGLPFVLIGRNNHIAWGLTNNGADVQDLFLLHVSQKDSNTYHYGPIEKACKIKSVVINIKDDDAPGGMRLDTLKIKLAEQGPIISRTAKSYLALKWIGHETAFNFEAFWGMANANHIRDFIQAANGYNGTPQNLLYADDKGNIGMQVIGSIPQRNPASPWNSFFPADGGNHLQKWVGLRTGADLPHIFNPPEGYIASSNNPTFAPDDIRAFPQKYAPGYRVARVRELIITHPDHTLESFQKIQNDHESLLADELVPLWAKQLAAIKSLPYAKYLQFLEKADKDNSANSQGFSLYEVFRRRYAFNTFRDELGDSLAEAYLDNWYVSQDRWKLISADSTSHWLDDVATKTVETRADIMRRSWKEAVESLGSSMEKNTQTWRWGNFHKISFKHPFSDVLPWLEFVLDGGSYEMAGDGESLNRAAFHFKAATSAPFDVKFIATYRQIVDMDDVEHALGVLDVGQSGHPGSSHYTDQIKLWYKGEYLNWDLFPSGKMDVLNISPRSH